MITQKCELCGKTYKVSNYRIGISRYCSQKCYHEATRKITKDYCINCGKEFIKYYENHPKKFCSFKCACEYRTKQPRKATLSKNRI